MLYLFITIILFGATISLILSRLNELKFKSVLPDALKDVYVAEEYDKSQNYQRENTKLSFISDMLETIATVLILLFGGFGLLDTLIRTEFVSNITTSLLFFAIIATANLFISLPFSIYGTFVIETKYGFNHTGTKLFITDFLKNILLTAAIGGLLLSAIVWFYYETTEYFWIYAWVIVSSFAFTMSYLYSNIIVPLFNKQTPLSEGELRNSIVLFAKQSNFPIKNIYVIDGSKRSSKANAYFSGFGRNKRIVLYDTLIEQLSINEIVAVLAHEIGHYKHKHTITGFLSTVLQTGVMLYLFSIIADNTEITAALGGVSQSFALSLIGFGIIYSPVSMIIGVITNFISRKNEYQADLYAASFGYGTELISALKKMSKKHLSNLTPHPWFVFVYYSHPTLYQRITAINYGK